MISKNIKEKIIFLIILLAFGASYRLIDYPPNFSPLGAIALFAGFYFNRWIFILLPLSILFLTDTSLGFYSPGIMTAVYLSFGLIFMIGQMVKKRDNFLLKIFGSITGSVLFFLITNFAVWFFGVWYERSAAGLLTCYTMAIPFFRNTLLGDLFFVGLLFGAYELYLIVKKSKNPILNTSKIIKNNTGGSRIGIILLIVALVLALGFYFIYFNKTRVDSPEENITLTHTVIEKIRINLEISTGSDKFSYQDEFDKGASAFEAMKIFSDKNAFSFKYSESDLGVFVTEILGTANDQNNNKYWFLYVNDESAQAGASEYILNDNDFVEWRFKDASEYFEE